jgi:hypothetical protein
MAISGHREGISSLDKKLARSKLASPENFAPSKLARPEKFAPPKVASEKVVPSKLAPPGKVCAVEVGVFRESRALEIGTSGEVCAAEGGGIGESRALEIGGCTIEGEIEESRALEMGRFGKVHVLEIVGSREGGVAEIGASGEACPLKSDEARKEKSIKVERLVELEIREIDREVDRPPWFHLWKSCACCAACLFMAFPEE